MKSIQLIVFFQCTCRCWLMTFINFRQHDCTEIPRMIMTVASLESPACICAQQHIYIYSRFINQAQDAFRLSDYFSIVTSYEDTYNTIPELIMISCEKWRSLAVWVTRCVKVILVWSPRIITAEKCQESLLYPSCTGHLSLWRDNADRRLPAWSNASEACTILGNLFHSNTATDRVCKHILRQNSCAVRRDSLSPNYIQTRPPRVTFTLYYIFSKRKTNGISNVILIPQYQRNANKNRLFINTTMLSKCCKLKQCLIHIFEI